jgi:hypothetical protein
MFCSRKFIVAAIISALLIALIVWGTSGIRLPVKNLSGSAITNIRIKVRGETNSIEKLENRETFKAIMNPSGKSAVAVEFTDVYEKKSRLN